MDVKTLVETKARAARAASRALALCSDPHEERGPRADGPGTRREDRGAPRGQPRRSRAGPRGRAWRAPSSTASPSPSRASRRWPSGLREIAALPDPVGETVVEPWRRPNGIEISPGARAARGDRLHLRVAAQRDGGRRRPLREVRQRRHPARRQRGDRVQRAHRGDPGQGRSRRRARRPTPSSSSTPPIARRWRAMLDAGRAGRSRHPARRRGVRALGGRALARARAQARQGAGPRLRGRRAPTSTWPTAIVHQRQGAAAERVQRAGDAAGRTARSPRASCPPSRRGWREAGVELRGCPETLAPACRARGRPRDADWDEEYLDLILADPRGRRSRRGAGPHPAARHGAGRGHRDQRSRPRPPLHARGRRRRGARQRLDAAGGRQPVRDGRRDGDLDLRVHARGPVGVRS